MARILIVDDEVPILRAVGTGLRARGHDVVLAETGEGAVSAAALQEPDVVILDLGLPDIGGVEVCKRIRQWSDVPIIVLSAHGSEARKVEALDEGADDFLTKPFSMAELEARLRVALRHLARSPGQVQDPTIVVGPLEVRLDARTVAIEGRQADLTAREFDLLAFLARHAGKVLTHRMLLEEVWGDGYGDKAHYLRVYVSLLRKKLEDDPARPQLLRTSPGVGYQLVTPELPKN